MKANQMTGFIVSTVLHTGLALVLLPLLWANEQKPAEPEPILLELSTFEPPPPPPVVIPEPVAETPITSEPPPPEPIVAEPTFEPPPPKKEKPVKPPKAAPKPVEENKPEPPPELKTAVEQPLPKPEPDPALLQQQEQERQRLAALREQRQHEFVEKQQQEQERQRLAQQKQQEQAKRRAEWGQAQQREAAKKRQAETKAKAEQQEKFAHTAAVQSKPVLAQAAHNSSSAMPLISNPRYRNPPSPPEYPRRALEAGIEGTVLVRVTISAEGRIMAALVHQSSGNASLDAAALKAVRSWAFLPAQRDGKTIPSIVQLPVRFKIS
ncbi:energy transducer TonB [uncultured Thiothrix sp.]|uniref:energy transducer TonB n=1 Tax=uncultured Thiothrix sp. TaxID=223185 RepID=UPI00260699A4|nr:energy transducer TonB [uncultured Thiothrix sp.]